MTRVRPNFDLYGLSIVFKTLMKLDSRIAEINTADVWGQAFKSKIIH